MTKGESELAGVTENLRDFHSGKVEVTWSRLRSSRSLSQQWILRLHTVMEGLLGVPHLSLSRSQADREGTMPFPLPSFYWGPGLILIGPGPVIGGAGTNHVPRKTMLPLVSAESPTAWSWRWGQCHQPWMDLAQKECRVVGRGGLGVNIGAAEHNTYSLKTQYSYTKSNCREMGREDRTPEGDRLGSILMSEVKGLGCVQQCKSQTSKTIWIYCIRFYFFPV